MLKQEQKTNKGIMKKLFLLVLFILAVYTPVLAEMTTHAMAKKLAVLHLMKEKPEYLLSKTPPRPSGALVSEFRWMLDTIKNRSINPTEAIGDSIYESWAIMNENGHKMSILETAHKLERITKNKKLLGVKKVNFRMVCQFWTISKIQNIDIETVINSSPYVNKQ